MLFIKIKPVLNIEKQGFFGRFTKKKHLDEAVRYNVKVNGDVHTVVEVSEAMLHAEGVTRLLNAYRGRIIVPEKHAGNPVFDGILFDDTPYKCMASVSSLISYVKNGTCKTMSVCVRIVGEGVFEILVELLPHIKSLAVVCEQGDAALEFARKCYMNYGVKPHLYSDLPECNFDIFADFTSFDKNCKSIITVQGKTAVLYPDPFYFADCSSYETFCEWGINNHTLCAALSAPPKTRS